MNEFKSVWTYQGFLQNNRVSPQISPHRCLKLKKMALCPNSGAHQPMNIWRCLDLSSIFWITKQQGYPFWVDPTIHVYGNVESFPLWQCIVWGLVIHHGPWNNNINNGEGVENLLEAAGGPIDCRPKGLKSAKCLGISILQVVVQKHLHVLKFTLPLVPCDKGIVMVYRYTHYLCIPGIQSPSAKGNGT